MEKSIRAYPELLALLRRKSARWLLAPNTASARSGASSTARRHGDFEDDLPTLMTTLSFVLGRRLPDERFMVHRSGAGAAKWWQSVIR